MFILYHDWDSVCSYKVRVCLDVKGIDYESRRVDLLRFQHLRPEYLQLNPNGVVPTLVHDGTTIIESSVINEYLDEVVAQPALKPDDLRARAKMRILVKLQDDVLYHVQRPATFQLIVKRMLSSLSREELDALVHDHPQPERARHFLDWATGPVDEKVVAEAKQKIDAVLARLEAELEGDWLAGDRFSLAEAAYAPFVDRLERLCFTDLWFDKPKVAAWIERVKREAAFASAKGPAEHRMHAPVDDLPA